MLILKVINFECGFGKFQCSAWDAVSASQHNLGILAVGNEELGCAVPSSSVPYINPRTVDTRCA
jgi:hypothetical protein